MSPSRLPTAVSHPLGRRDFLKAFGAAALFPYWSQVPQQKCPGVSVNDVQTEMNPTCVTRVVAVNHPEEIAREILRARKDGIAVSIAGGRHAAGGQQFGSGTVLLDMRSLHGVRNLDSERGNIEVFGGTEWPELMDFYLKAQKGRSRQWGVAQKQGGLDWLTMGGTLSANAHGHALAMAPIVSDVESFELVDSQGNVQQCSREKNAELFRLVIGGYGLFGVISRVTLKLIPRRKLMRQVEWARSENVMSAFEKRISGGCLYGDFQYSIDDSSEDFMRRGVLTVYRAAGPDAELPRQPHEFAEKDYFELLLLAHVNKREAFRRYAEACFVSSGEVVWSDTHQLSPYPRFYHHVIDQRLHAAHPATDLLTEVYVPRDRLADFLTEARVEILRRRVSLVYGTVRLIERDSETFLPWARQNYACVIFTIHTEHTLEGEGRTADTFRSLIDMARRRGGSYYLTYHRDATREQVAACYPQFPEFLHLKRKYDPAEVFQSDWYRHYRDLFRKA